MPKEAQEDSWQLILRGPSAPVLLNSWLLENVTKLKLPDTSSVNIADVEIAGIEPKIVERGIRYITRTRRELRRVQ